MPSSSTLSFDADKKNTCAAYNYNGITGKFANLNDIGINQSSVETTARR